MPHRLRPLRLLTPLPLRLLRELNDLRTYRSEAYLARSQPDGDQIVAMAGGPARVAADADVIDDDD